MSGSITQLSATHATVDTCVLIDFDAMANWSSDTLQGITGDGGRMTVTFIFGTTDDGAPNVMEIPNTLIHNNGSVIGWSDPFPDDIGGGHDDHLYRVRLVVIKPCWSRQTKS